jgi:hypothetical protein
MTELGRLLADRKTGREVFHARGKELGFDLLSFWQWTTSDLISNATRGRLAEYLVARAIGLGSDGVRDEWAAYDLCSADGTKIEVKSAAYVQSWHQRAPSSISFVVPKTLAWDAETNRLATEAQRQADVYVFALLAHTDKATIDALDVSQWRFYVLPTAVLNSRTRSQHSITLKSLEALAGPGVDYWRLKDAIEAAAAQRPLSSESGRVGEQQ